MLDLQTRCLLAYTLLFSPVTYWVFVFSFFSSLLLYTIIIRVIDMIRAMERFQRFGIFFCYVSFYVWDGIGKRT